MSGTANLGVKRHYWVAALLGLLGVGLGYFYVGRPRLGVAIWVLAIALPFATMHVFGQYLIGVGAAAAVLVTLMAVTYFGPLALIAKNRMIAAERRPKRWQYVIWVIGAVILGNVWALAMRPVADYRLYNIPAGSMAPTLMPGDAVIVRQLHKKEHKASLEPGAVVVFLNRKDADELGRPQEYVKRVLATGGQTIEFRDGGVILDGAPVPQQEEGVRDIVQYGGETESILHLREQLGGHSYSVLDVWPRGGPLDNVGPYEVPQGHYFTVGDNRDRSQDSRVLSAVGYVPEEDIVGEALYIAFSMKDLSRIGKRLDD